MRPTVAVDANPLARLSVTGTELYARELCRRLPAAAPDLDWRFYGSAPAAGVDITVLPARRLWTQARLPVELALRPPDLLFIPSHAAPFLSRVPFVVTVHDLAYELYPSAYSRAALSYLRVTTRWAAARARLLLTPSEATRQDLIQRWGVPPSRVRAIHAGGGEGVPEAGDPAGDEALLRGLGIDRPFALMVGRVEDRKNQATALRALESVPGLLLVSAGPVVDAALAQRMRAAPWCRVLGRVDDTVRDALYRRASLLLFPSLYEGFGFPLVEAMRHGLPAVTSRASSMPEVAGDAALYVENPLDPVELAAAVRRASEDLVVRRQLSQAGRRRAAQFTWERTAVGVAAAIREALSL